MIPSADLHLLFARWLCRPVRSSRRARLNSTASCAIARMELLKSWASLLLFLIRINTSAANIVAETLFADWKEGGWPPLWNANQYLIGLKGV